MTDEHTQTDIMHPGGETSRAHRKGNPGKFFSGYLKFGEPTFSRWQE